MPSVSRFNSLEREKIVKWAQEVLWSKEQQGAPGRQYLLEKRQIKEKTARMFNIGYVPQSKHQLANRVIFPVYDASNNLIAVSSRAVDDNDTKLPKYWHEQYNKSFYLYGMNLAKERARQKGFIILVEGNFDVVKAHDEGLTNVVGLMGTTVSDYHLAILLRYCENVIFCFDNDENKAGEKAGEKISYKLKFYNSPVENGTLNIVNFSVMKLPKEKDPDEFIKKNGIIAFKTLVKKELEKINGYPILS